jgi:cysteine synthase A
LDALTLSLKSTPTISMEKYWQATILLSGIAIGAGAVLAAENFYVNWPSRRVSKRVPEALRDAEDIRNGLEECIGNTPLIRIKCLSEATGCEILGKAEVCLNTTQLFLANAVYSS